MPKVGQLSISPTFESFDIVTGYGSAEAEGFDGVDIEEYLKSILQITAVELNTTTNIPVLTLADGSQIVGTTST
jgi:hypothetical protein